MQNMHADRSNCPQITEQNVNTQQLIRWIVFYLMQLMAHSYKLLTHQIITTMCTGEIIIRHQIHRQTVITLSRY